MQTVDRHKLAVALKYAREQHAAPVIAAKGKGYMAQQILHLAERYGVPVQEDADLVQLLEKLDIDTPIPLEAYAAVAEILAYVYRTNAARTHARMEKGDGERPQ